jgi:hypothetical protein
MAFLYGDLAEELYVNSRASSNQEKNNSYADFKNHSMDLSSLHENGIKHSTHSLLNLD